MLPGKWREGRVVSEKGRRTDYRRKLAASVKFYSLKNMGGGILAAQWLGLQVFTGGAMGCIPGQILQAAEWRREKPQQTAGLLAPGGGNKVLGTQIAVFLRHFYTALSKTLGKQEGKKAFPGRRNSPVKGCSQEVKSCDGGPRASRVGGRSLRERFCKEAERRSALHLRSPGSDFGVSVRGEAPHPSFCWGAHPPEEGDPPSPNA